MKRLLTLAGLVALLSTLVLAADAAGTWKGAFDFDGTSVPVILTTHEATQGAFDRALRDILALPAISRRHTVLRMLD